jgi:hypothetical protein
MTFTKALIGLAAAVALSGANAAAVVAAPGGTLGANPVNSYFYGISGGFTNTYSFSLSGSPSFNLSTSFAALFSPAYVSSITVAGGSFTQTVTNPTTDFAAFTGLTSGSYTISFATTTAGFGNLVGNVTATPVPEAQTIALALAGVGVVSMLRRRRAQNA